MKTSLLALILFLLVPVPAVPGKKTESGATNRRAPAIFWPQDSKVNVYFVRGLFTSGQKQILWQTLETWTQRPGATSTIRFLYAGETGGLIDCLGCLTMTRQEVYTNDPKRQVSFNRLRDDPKGLISAWIGFDSAITDSQKLRDLLVQILVKERPIRADSSNVDVLETSQRQK